MKNPNKHFITYVTADEIKISVEVSIEIRDLLKQTNRKIASQKRQDSRYVKFIDVDNSTMNYLKTTNPADIVIKKERNERINSAIEELPEIQRRRLKMYFVEGLTYAQIAEIEGVNQGTVHRSVKKALRRLYKTLTK